MTSPSENTPSPTPAVPSIPPTPAALQHQLKENEAQRTEITGYINQLGIQLHRWKLRLQTLQERQKKLEAELASTSGKKAESA